MVASCQCQRVGSQGHIPTTPEGDIHDANPYQQSHAANDGLCNPVQQEQVRV